MNIKLQVVSLSRISIRSMFKVLFCLVNNAQSPNPYSTKYELRKNSKMSSAVAQSLRYFSTVFSFIY